MIIKSKKHLKEIDAVKNKKRNAKLRGQDFKSPQLLEHERRVTRRNELLGKPVRLDDKKNKKLGDY